MTGAEYLQNVLFPLGAAMLMGGLVGLEREARGHWAGLRTHLLVALGSALFLRVGVNVTDPSPAELSRIVQGVAAGVGFIGAGTILKLHDAESVKGLTTASSIWAAAALGVASGTKQYLLAFTGTVLALIVLFVLRHAEHQMGSSLSPRKSDSEDECQP